MQSRARRLPMACVTKTRSFQTMGDELPGSGSSRRQRTFLFVDHVIGKSISSVAPFWFGPRHWGQLLARTVIDAKKSRRSGVMDARVEEDRIFPSGIWKRVGKRVGIVIALQCLPEQNRCMD